MLIGILLLPAAAGTGIDATWANLRSLAGEWEGSFGAVKGGVTFTILSGGSVVMESMKMPPPAPDMVTMYHRDGTGLVATHYCSMGNQPRMRASEASPDGKTVRFRFADITNLAKPVHPMLRRQPFDRLSGRISPPDLFEQFHLVPPVHPGIMPSGPVQVGQIRRSKWAKSDARTHRGLQRCITTQWWDQYQTEERRVAYVATTRARRAFILCVHQATYDALRNHQPAFFASFQQEPTPPQAPNAEQ